MKLIKPSVQIIEQNSYDINSIFKTIEFAGRTCYKSEDKITEDSAKEFVERMVKSGHGAMLEHGTVYLHIKDYYNSEASKTIGHYTGTNTIINSNFSIKEMQSNPYSKYNIIGLGLHGRQAYITTNYRVLVENSWLDDLKYLCKPTEYHERRTTVKFICDRGVSHEFVRHRVFSFAQESTRYCNYTKDKFDSELTFIIPCWIKDIKEDNYYSFIDYHSDNIDGSKEWYDSCLNAEKVYFTLIEDDNWKPQEARSVLPNSLKTELIMTGFDSDWQNFFKLRCAPNAHPQAKELADMLKNKFNK